MTDFAQFLFALFWYGVFILLPGGAFSVLMHFLLSLPMHRRDRALFFSTCWKPSSNAASRWNRPFSPPRKIRIAPSASPFTWWPRTSRAGTGSARRSKKFRLPPPQITAILRTGEKLGDLKRVLPACREVLRIAPDTVRSTMHYMVAILLIFAPVACMLITLLSAFVIPQFKEVAKAWIFASGRSRFRLSPQ